MSRRALPAAELCWGQRKVHLLEAWVKRYKKSFLGVIGVDKRVMACPGKQNPLNKVSEECWVITGHCSPALRQNCHLRHCLWHCNFVGLGPKHYVNKQRLKTRSVERACCWGVGQRAAIQALGGHWPYSSFSSAPHSKVRNKNEDGLWTTEWTLTLSRFSRLFPMKYKKKMFSIDWICENPLAAAALLSATVTNIFSNIWLWVTLLVTGHAG